MPRCRPWDSRLGGGSACALPSSLLLSRPTRRAPASQVSESTPRSRPRSCRALRGPCPRALSQSLHPLTVQPAPGCCRGRSTWTSFQSIRPTLHSPPGQPAERPLPVPPGLSPDGSEPGPSGGPQALALAGADLLALTQGPPGAPPALGSRGVYTATPGVSLPGLRHVLPGLTPPRPLDPEVFLLVSKSGVRRRTGSAQRLQAAHGSSVEKAWGSCVVRRRLGRV